MFDEAKARLRRLEASHGIRILYACEAGSRSWGFPSPSSDYDIRFIYVRPLKNYLKLTPPADTITLDQDGVWDISGWDLKKCLMLLKKGNVSIVQSLYSQIVYRNHPLFLAEMRKLLDYGAPLPRLYWAYRSMAQSHVSHFLLGHETIAYKRFLYIVQGLLGRDPQEHAARGLRATRRRARHGRGPSRGDRDASQHSAKRRRP